MAIITTLIITMTTLIITVRSFNEQAIQTTRHLHYIFYTECKQFDFKIIIIITIIRRHFVELDEHCDGEVRLPWPT